MINYYEVLNCNADASLKKIRENYKKLVLQFHPDKANISDSQQFFRIQEAWNILSDERKRQQFDEEVELRSSRPFLYGTFKISELLKDTKGNNYCICRCGGYYYLNCEEIKLVETFHLLHVPCENCSLTAQIIL
ncbi:hypothetical protein PGB90_004783 [Kerria lacca]